MNSIPWLVDDKLKKKVASKQQKKYIQDTLKSNPNYFINQIKPNTKMKDIYFPSIQIKAIIEDKFDSLFFLIEHKILCCMSNFYKYSIQSGNTYGDIFNNKKKDFIFYYDVYDGCTEWKDF